MCLECYHCRLKGIKERKDLHTEQNSRILNVDVVEFLMSDGVGGIADDENEWLMMWLPLFSGYVEKNKR